MARQERDGSRKRSAGEEKRQELWRLGDGGHHATLRRHLSRFLGGREAALRPQEGLQSATWEYFTDQAPSLTLAVTNALSSRGGPF